MTQEELATASTIPQPSISSIESRRATHGAERAEKLAANAPSLIEAHSRHY